MMINIKCFNAIISRVNYLNIPVLLYVDINGDHIFREEKESHYNIIRLLYDKIEVGVYLRDNKEEYNYGLECKCLYKVIFSPKEMNKLTKELFKYMDDKVKYKLRKQKIKEILYD